MSIPGFGNVVPIHFSILSLAGWKLETTGSGLLRDDSERLAEMRRGRENSYSAPALISALTLLLGVSCYSRPGSSITATPTPSTRWTGPCVTPSAIGRSIACGHSRRTPNARVTRRRDNPPMQRTGRGGIFGFLSRRWAGR
jgi:hypothetical protein